MTIDALPKELLFPHQVDGVSVLISKGGAISDKPAQQVLMNAG
jgi:hypothetical protein